MSLLEILGIVIAVLVIAGIVYWWLRRSPGAGLSDDERALMKAKTFDRYTLRRVRKRAVLSTMYQAVDQETKASVALRILRPDLAVDPDQVKSFKRRGEIIEYLNKEHPDLPFVRLSRYGQFKAGRTVRPFIAVEYFEGQDLGELLEEKKALPVAEAVAIVTQVARALGVVLREKVWHHQMTLQAVMVRYQKGGSPEAKLVDFDLARQEQGGGGGADARLTFMSPEQFENKIVDDRSDVYSLGALFYLLLTGRPPFAGADYAETARLQKTEPPPPLPASIPEPVRALVTKMLQRQPQDRYRSMEEVVEVCKRLEVQPSWHAAPDTTGIRPIAAAAQPTEAAAPAAVRERVSKREPAPRRFGGAANVLREILAMVVSPFSTLFSKLTPVKIGFGIAVLVIGAIAYLLLRSNAVSGEITIQVASSKGAPVSGAAVVIEPVAGGEGQPSVKFTDVVTDASMKGKLEAKTSSAGTLKLEYSVTPETKFSVRISAPEYLDRLDSFVIRRDTTLSLAYTLAPKPVAAPMMVFVHDKAKNPIGSVIVRISGKSGKEHTVTTDARGKANLEINPAAEGNAPEVSLSAPSLGTDFAQSSPRQEKLTSSGMSIDINDYFPFDKTLDRSIKEAEGFLRNKDWEKARTPLLKAAMMRPGQGSARTYTYLAQAWWEDDKDNYRETLEAAKKAIADKEKVSGADRNSIIEKMHYYEVKALYQAWRENKTASNKQETLSASRRYLSMMKGPAYASALKKNKLFDSHNDDVQDIYDKVK
jgi:serine/threonine-protein kinase